LSETVRAALGLGSNVAPRRAHLERAIAALRERTEVVAVSRIRETEPVGGPPQGRYRNAAVVVRTDRSPHDLLALAHELERAAGRTRTVRWGPRTLDVDVLLYADRRVATDDLEVPHPRLTERAFVLEPLAEIAADWVVPGTGGRTVEELLEALRLHR